MLQYEFSLNKSVADEFIYPFREINILAKLITGFHQLYKDTT